MRAKSRSPRAKAENPIRRPKKAKAEVGETGISEEFRFLTENAKALEAYPGEWLLIRGYRLVMHSPDYKEIERVIQTEKIECPFLFRVPTAEEVNFI